MTAAASAYVLRDYVDNGLPVIALIALYTVASLTPRRQWGAAVAAISVLLLALTLFRGEDLSPAELAGNIAIFAIAAVFGDSVRTRRAYTSQLELRAVDLEANQEAQAQRAVAEERLRIARELHDVVAHAMSVVAVQSGVGAHVIDTDPAEAKRILENVKTSSRMALNEMRRLLGVLRDEGDGPVSRTPAAGLEGVDELADGLRQAGMNLAVRVEGTRPVVPPGVDLSAFRIVQEALTNVLKHAGPATVEVAICYHPDSVTVEVEDDGRGASTAPADGHAGRRPWAGGHAGAGRRLRRPPHGRQPGRRRFPGGGHTAVRGSDVRDDRHESGQPVIRVLVADDQNLVRAGFRVLIDSADDCCVVAEAADGAEAVALALEHRPDVVLMDVRMPGLDGIAATRQIVADERTATTRILVLTTFDLDDHVFDALQAGASGFLLKDTDPEDLLNAVRVVAAGDALLSPRITGRVIAQFVARPGLPRVISGRALDPLTDREREVLAEVGRGLSNAEIAEELYVSAATAKTHVSRIMSKLGARDRVQLVVLAYESGLINPGTPPG